MRKKCDYVRPTATKMSSRRQENAKNDKKWRENLGKVLRQRILDRVRDAAL